MKQNSDDILKLESRNLPWEEIAVLLGILGSKILEMYLRDLTPGKRVEFFAALQSQYCLHCGDSPPKYCQCDE